MGNRHRIDRDKLVVKLLKELPELLADYEHCAQDADGKVDAIRKKRVAKIGSLVLRIQTGQGGN
jgi:hypothetical protein